jgi:RNA polymerase sigma-70 factor (ECF subfamily)
VSSSVTARFPSVTLTPQTASNSSGVPEIRSAGTEFSDESLLNNICAGDRESLALLFRRFAHPVRNVGQRILRNKAEADDLVQEVFLYIRRKSELFDSSKGSARSWIIQVAYTQALLRRRELKSHGFYLTGIADRPVECEQASSKGAHYDHTVEGLFGRNAWKKIVEDLSEDQRETFWLHFFEGYTFAEIAEKLGQSYANVRNHHYRGLEKLRKQLAADELNRR